MIGGILIGIGITALAFIIVWLLKQGNTPSVFTYILIVVMLIVLCFEGILMISSIKARDKVGNVTETVRDAMMTYLPTENQDYAITAEQATAIKFGLRLVVPTVVDKIDFDNMTGKSVGEFTDTVCLSVEQTLAKQVRKMVWLLVITSIALTVLLYFTIPDGARKKGTSSRGNARNTRGRSANTRRAPRRVHR